jgi:hypothetical protein
MVHAPFINPAKNTRESGVHTPHPLERTASVGCDRTLAGVGEDVSYSIFGGGCRRDGVRTPAQPEIWSEPPPLLAFFRCFGARSAELAEVRHVYPHESGERA